MRRKRQYSEFGLWASGILAELNMTQAELAEAMGYSSTTINEVFTGRNKNILLQQRIRQLLLERLAEHDKNRAI